MSLGGKSLKESSFWGHKRLLPVLLIVSVAVGAYVLDKVLSKEDPVRPWAEDVFPQEIAVKCHTCYLKCGDVITETVTVPASDVQTFLAGLSSQWELFSEEGSVREYKRTEDDYCPVHSRFRFITIHGGFVSVYRGKESQQQQFFVRDFRHLSESSLRDNERALLSNGVVLEDEPHAVDAKVAKFLEGLVD